jgi:hypothetical protein
LLLIKYLKVVAGKVDVSEQIEDGLVEIVISIKSWEQNILSNPNVTAVLEASCQLFSTVVNFLVAARIHYERSWSGL